MKKRIKADIGTAILNRVFSFFLVLSLLMACNAQKGISQGDNLVKEQDSLILLLQDNYSGNENEEALVIRSTKELQRFFTKINRTRKPRIPVPTIDFSIETALIFCAGPQLGEKRSILSICEQTSDTIFVCPELSQVSKGPTSGVSISPFSVYKIPNTQKRIIFKKYR